MPHFTGIDDPYEQPIDPEITLDTANFSIEESVTQIIRFLQEQGYLATEKETATMA